MNKCSSAGFFSCKGFCFHVTILRLTEFQELPPIVREPLIAAEALFDCILTPPHILLGSANRKLYIFHAISIDKWKCHGSYIQSREISNYISIVQISDTEFLLWTSVQGNAINLIRRGGSKGRTPSHFHCGWMSVLGVFLQLDPKCHLPSTFVWHRVWAFNFAKQIDGKHHKQTAKKWHKLFTVFHTQMLQISNAIS